MNVDVEQFHAVFFDESNEHLQAMEDLLMTLDVDNPDSEALNSIFRAAHSIKGGSGIFGFDALTGLTHVMETLLDRARNQTMSLSVEIVDLFLETVDTLNATLQAYKDGGELPSDAINAGIDRLEAVLGSTGSSEPVAQAGESDDVLAESEDADDGFGFFDFDDIAEPATAVDATDDLFGDLAFGAEASTDNPQAPDGKETDDISGFGFFDDEALPAQPAASQSEKSQPAPVTPKQNVTPIAKGKAVSQTKTPAKESGSIRVDTYKIDGMVNLVGELVITQSMLSMIGNEVDGKAGEMLQTAIDELQRNTREIQESVMSMRMLPVNMTFNRFPRVVRDLSQKLGKQVKLVIEGGATEIDKSLIEKLVDPLTHLVRNSIDHGIESPETRQAAGKPASGTVVLSAAQKGSSIIISIQDDGAGLNRERILNKAMENGLIHSDDMPDSDIWKLIFEPGFSTAAEVTDVSGRGVGMDVVRRNIESIGGRIEIESKVGEGSSFNIHLPLTLAIVDGMCVAVGDQIFVVPLLNIIESFQPRAEQLQSLSNDNVLWIRGEYWPLVALHELMDVEGAIDAPEEGIVVLLESGKKRFGVQVDALLGQQQVVIKSLEKHYRKVAGVAGATIMGDGKVALILDADSIAQTCQDALKQEACA
ncbi:two-component system, chemotaxis family, sensor kinase CheA [Marisediminitalea aggregata]|uniref:Chemotaxis protein CheA n=1 Tax=Marisediminitalea aggregata TaxID=634436 RepID=A0A1M5LQU5_9ALTE|nr:chemotaxis protein CheA [Marisediminitalea aggregata]MEC7825171.1 chemotaxis protein CheA [Pseudomonadota bacterium]SHG66713.1 two-component system, chemotaxis family, sensor kinase CheA [Marisediminitalea aggregata]